MGIGRRIKELRKRAGMTQTQLAAATGVNPSMIAQIERLTIKSQARNAEERQKFRRFKRGIAKLTSFWTPT